MAADYGINVSVQTTRRHRNEFELCGHIAQKTFVVRQEFKKEPLIRHRAYSLQQVSLRTGTDPGHLVLDKALPVPASRALESTNVQTFQQSSALNPLQQRSQFWEYACLKRRIQV